MPKKINTGISPSALTRAREVIQTPFGHSYRYPIQAPALMPGVVPRGQKAPILAMDSPEWAFAQQSSFTSGFPGYPYLAMLATRAEYRAFASALSTEITREWITFDSSETSSDETKGKITEIEQAFRDLGVRHVIKTAVEHDCYFGRGQIFIEIEGQDRELPLILDARTIKKGSLKRICNIEPMWTTPSAYNALDPAAPDFYKPTKWFVMGKQVHASRLLSIVTRPLPDMLKPAFNFSGMSLSQLAEPYVDNWLRTRQSVSDLINNFSITALATSMDQVLTGGDDGAGLIKRAELFTLHRANKGLMLLDKDREDLVQVNTPLSGLDALQAQSQEQMCSVSTVPSTVLLGVAPTGFGNVSEGELATWENRVSAAQEADYRSPLEIILKVVQLSMYGKIDPDITFSFKPLRQMTPKEIAEIRTANSTTAANYIDRGVIDSQEERERLARDTESGYQGLDITKVLEVEEPAPGEGESDNEEV
jgi:uncharacterized protein